MHFPVGTALLVKLVFMWLDYYLSKFIGQFSLGKSQGKNLKCEDPGNEFLRRVRDLRIAFFSLVLVTLIGKMSTSEEF